eukprot:4779831-Prymnesium_polylepis.1
MHEQCQYKRIGRGEWLFWPCYGSARTVKTCGGAPHRHCAVPVPKHTHTPDVHHQVLSTQTHVQAAVLSRDGCMWAWRGVLTHPCWRLETMRGCDAATTCDSSAIARAHARQRQSAISPASLGPRGELTDSTGLLPDETD